MRHADVQAKPTYGRAGGCAADAQHGLCVTVAGSAPEQLAHVLGTTLPHIGHISSPTV